MAEGPGQWGPGWQGGLGLEEALAQQDGPGKEGGMGMQGVPGMMGSPCLGRVLGLEAVP